MQKSAEELLNTYLNVSGAYQLHVLPKQNAFTFLSKKTGIPQVWSCGGDGGEIQQVTDLEDRVMTVSHSPSGTQTIVGMDHKGNEKQQLYLISQDGSQVEKLVVSPEHFHHFGGWSPDETKIAYSSNRREAGFFDVFIMDLDSKSEEAVFNVDGNCTPECWTKDGQSLILSMPDTNIDQSYFILDLQTKNVNKIGKEKDSARNQFIQLSEDQTGGFLLSDRKRDTLGILRFFFDDPSQYEMLLTDEDWDVDGMSLSPDNSLLAYTLNEGGFSKLGIYDLRAQTERRIEGLPEGIYSSLAWLNQQELLLVVQSAVLPGDIWKVSLENGASSRLTFTGQAPEVEELWMEPELTQFSSFDGLKVPYFLYGKREESQPVVIYVHGGPEYQIRPEFNPVIQFLAAQGFAVVAPNVRGSMGYGRKYVKLDDGRKRMNAVADLKGLANDLVQNHGVDEQRIGIMGRSYGGFMVLAAMTHYPAIWAAGVNIVGISHFKSFLKNTGPWRRKLREFEYGSLEKDGDFFEKIAPLNHTHNICAPLLMFHGRNDTRVPVTEAIQLKEDLQGQEKEVELVIFEDEGHQTEKLANHILMNTRIVQFMQKYL